MRFKGFTLIELLIVIAIISILSVIGYAVIGNSQKATRDARRVSDLNTITKVLEVNKTSAGYQPLASSQFSGDVIPQDPGNNVYCLSLVATWSLTNTTWTNKTICPTDWTVINKDTTGIPTANTASWRVCIALEASSTSIVCKKSLQGG